MENFHLGAVIKNKNIPMRADEYLVKNGIVESRSKARTLIESGGVFFESGALVDKPSRKIPDGVSLVAKGACSELKYVSRAGIKLERALEEFFISLGGAVALDAGASTGGFTDCMLSWGAKRVFCVDVGTAQLHPKIAGDARVENLEKTDVRDISSDFFIENYPSDFPSSGEDGIFDFIAGDLSFISLEKVLDGLFEMLKPGCKAVFLVKPQFEAGIDAVKKGRGVVRDKAQASAAADKICKYAASLRGSKVLGLIDSPILGGDGNKEFLLCLEKTAV